MSDIIAIEQNNTNFTVLHNKSYRLAAAVFTISNIIDTGEELRTKIRNLSLDLVSMTVNLRDINFSDARKLVLDIEKRAIELMSLLDIASIAGLISKMNGDILKDEFGSFISELQNFSKKFEENRNVSVNNIFIDNTLIKSPSYAPMPNKDVAKLKTDSNPTVINPSKNYSDVNGGSKRKDNRKAAILEYIKGHSDANIKDIAPNVVGCSEKTIQRELIALIEEGKIKKIGERRWSRYSII